MSNTRFIRSQFPALNQVTAAGHSPIFFDAPGGAQVNQHVVKGMTDYLSRYNANLGAPYFSSQKTTQVMQDAREHVAVFLNAQAQQIVFGPTATNLMFGISRAISQTWQAGDEIIVSALDHYANVSSWQWAAEEKGVVVHQVRIDPETHVLDYEHLECLMNHRTKLVAVTHASNVTGGIVDVARVVKLAQSFGALSFVDAVHYAPHQLVDVKAINCDFLVISAYKFTGPHVAALYAKTEHLERFKPYKVEPAADVNPNQWEQGTQNFEALAGLSACIEYLASLSGLSDMAALTSNNLRARLEASYAWIHAHEKALGDYFISQLADYPMIEMYGAQASHGRTPTFAFRIKGQMPRSFSEYCALEGLCVGDGHFYAQGLMEQLGLMTQGGVIRLGFLHYNTKEEIDHFFAVLKRYVCLEMPLLRSETLLV